METIIFSILALFSALFVAFKKGQSNEKINQKIKTNEETIKILQDQKDTKEFVNNLPSDKLDDLLFTESK